MTQQLLLGQTVQFTHDPFFGNPEDAAQINARGGVLIEDGRIVAVGNGDDLRRTHPQARVTDHRDGLITAGFVDAHMHYPQTAMIASWGKRLIDWLNTYTFPEEMRFADRAYADDIAGRALDLALAHGTTTQASFCTIHPTSVDAFFEAATARGMAVVGGKTCMDRNAPDGLRDTAQTAYDDSKALLEKWHGRGRITYAITPRFSPTSAPDQLAALGALWTEHPDALMQTHLSEQLDEIAWVRDLFPDARDYLDTYETFGLLGDRGLYGHAIHLEPRELDRLAEVGAAVVHCPTSNTFIGSGLFDLLRGTALHPAQLMWLATEGSAQALLMGGEIGSLNIGAAADIAVLDLASTPAISQRSARADTVWEALFPTIMMGDDRAIKAVYVAGVAV